MVYFRGENPNFGDELNPWLWPRLLPGFFDEDESTVFIGIGSIIGMHEFPAAARKIVCGAGFVPQYHGRPDLSGDWDFYFVRGPRTARALGLSPDLALGDSAILLRAAMREMPPRAGEVVSFMPHWQSMGRGHWEEACRLAGLNLIDPRRPVEDVLREIMRSRHVIAEAMHGAIVADALRVPWIPLLPLNRVHREKWHDWAEALEIKLPIKKLFPSSLAEARLSFLRGLLTSSPFAGKIDRALTYLAAQRLSWLAGVTPCLSAPEKIEEATEKMLEKLEILKKRA